MKNTKKIKAAPATNLEGLLILKRFLDGIDNATPGEIQGALVGLAQQVVDLTTDYPDQLTRGCLAMAYLEVALNANKGSITMREKFTPLETLKNYSDAVN